MRKKTKDGTLILLINALTASITFVFTLYRVEWDLVDSFFYFIFDMFFAFFRNLTTVSYIFYLSIEWGIKTPILYFLSKESNIKIRKKHALLGAIPFFGFAYGWHLKFKKAATSS